MPDRGDRPRHAVRSSQATCSRRTPTPSARPRPPASSAARTLARELQGTLDVMLGHAAEPLTLRVAGVRDPQGPATRSRCMHSW
jgi:hypothetical protein